MIVWGSELSPYALKVRALFDYAGVPYRWLPADGSRWENYRAQWRIDSAKRRRTVLRYPRTSALDEYPLVPFVVDDDGQVLYDSSAIAGWLDARQPRSPSPLLPPDPALAFVARLIDEAFDEIGLYCVHHARWVLSAATNDAGARLGGEFRRVLPPGGGPILARRFAARQVRRLPYLFSVAPAGFRVDGLAAELTPPSRPGFPPTHALLDELRLALLEGVEAVLSRQPFLLGERFTLADASIYGQLGMNLKDPSAANDMRLRAPTTFAWLVAIRDRAHVQSRGALVLADALRPLLATIMRAFVPLMRQNARAYDAARAAGETRFNEPAFNRGLALYDGELLGHPFRSVAKSFQVQVWQEIRAAWTDLDAAGRAQVVALLPSLDAADAFAR